MLKTESVGCEMRSLDTVKMTKTDFIRLALALPDTESFDDNTICAPELPPELPLPCFKVRYDFEDEVDVEHFAIYVEPRYTYYLTAPNWLRRTP